MVLAGVTGYYECRLLWRIFQHSNLCLCRPYRWRRGWQIWRRRPRRLMRSL